MNPPRPGRVAALAAANVSVWIRIALVALILGAFLLVWWSLARLTTQQKANLGVSSEIGRLSSEIEIAETRLAASEATGLDATLETVKSRLLDAPEDAVRWLDIVGGEAAPLDLDLRIEVGQATPTELDPTLATLPITLNVRPRTDGQSLRSAYERVLDFGHRLTCLDLRTDLLQLTLATGTNSVESATARIQLWAKLEEQP